MKYRHKQLVGNILKSLGLIMMLGGIVFTIVAQHPEMEFLSIFNIGSLGVIFIGALFWLFIGVLFWLFGAHIGAKQCIIERYWFSRHS